MSFWSHRASLLVMLVGASGSALAQEYYLQPRGYVGAEVDSNRDLVTSGPKTTSEGYAADLGATVGIATPQSDTTLRPEVAFYDYPKLSESSVKSVLDFLSNYHTQRAQYGIYGEYSYAN